MSLNKAEERSALLLSSDEPPATEDHSSDDPEDHCGCGGIEMTAPVSFKSVASVHPSMLAISYDQLLQIDELALSLFGVWRYRSKTMRDVNEHIIIPRCNDCDTSYSLWLNRDGLKLDAFITHSWDEPFADFVDSIRDAFQPYAKKPNLWICSFALQQGCSQRIQDELNVPLEESPFVKALSEATWFVVVRNAKKDLYSRIWCVCELIFATKFGFTSSSNTMVIGSDNFSNEVTSCKDAECYDDRDREKILDFLRSEGTTEEIDALVMQYRTHENRLEKIAKMKRRAIMLGLPLILALAVLVYVVYTRPEVEVPAEVDLFGERFDLETTRVSMSGKRLVGTIPTEIGRLTGVKILSLTDGHLTGSIPTELCRLTNLMTLNLYNNSLSGSFPSIVALAWREKLKFVQLQDNNFTGTIPKFKSLRGLDLHNNHFSGSLDVLGEMTGLWYVSANNNSLVGTLPSTLGGLGSLGALKLANNRLSGTIPREIAMLTGLDTIDLEGNDDIVGPLPTSVCNYLNQRNYMLPIDCQKKECPPECECACKNQHNDDHEEVDKNGRDKQRIERDVEIQRVRRTKLVDKDIVLKCIFGIL